MSLIGKHFIQANAFGVPPSLVRIEAMLDVERALIRFIDPQTGEGRPESTVWRIDSLAGAALYESFDDAKPAFDVMAKRAARLAAILDHQMSVPSLVR